MTKQELLEGIISVLKDTEHEIKELQSGASFEKPVEADLVKTKKAMAYENILAEFRKFKSKNS